jgi:hypothetical protein
MNRAELNGEVDIERLAKFLLGKGTKVDLATLSFPDKIKAIITMQKMVAPILRARGKKVRVW